MEPVEPGRRAPLRGLWERLNRTRPRRWALRATAAVGAIVLLALVGLTWLYSTVELPEQPQLAQRSVVLAAGGEELSPLYDEENRIEVDLAEVSPVMRDATLAAEDRDFYDHSGLAPLAIGRALWNDLRGRELQGGSTITQQLIKNTYLTPERSLTRKVREAILAVKIEKRLTKDAILERYLNTVYFGRGAHGIEVAAQAYFGKPAAELELHEAALLAGLIRAPELADPDEEPEEAERRREIVLQAMVATGDIDETEAEAASEAPVDTRPYEASEPILEAGGSAYFVEQVRQWAVEEFGERAALTGGLRIRTTLDVRMQQAAEGAVAETLDEPDDPAAAVVTIDDTGAIRAMVGGRDFASQRVNLALGEAGGGTGRQAGSTFKPFVLAAALDSGMLLRQRFPAPAEITVETEEAGPYPVSNYENEAYGELDLEEATVSSVNTVYAQLVAELGVGPVADMAHAAGIESEIPPHPSVALGAATVSPLEMARAFMTFGNRGARVTPYYVTEVTDADGAVLYKVELQPEQAIESDVADLVNHVLQQVPVRGTGRAARIDRPMAGKTGTTQEFGDAWFVGYTPRLSTAVWMGYPEGQTRPMDDVHGRAVTGGSFPAQIWRAYMEVAVEGIDTGEFEPPADELLEPPAPPPPPPPPPTSETTTTTTESTTTTTTEPPSTTTTEKKKDEQTTTTTSSTTSSTTTTTTEEERTKTNGNGSRSP